MSYIFPDGFGEMIRIARESRKLSQADLSRELNTSRPTIANWETSKTYPTLKDLRPLCELLGLSPYEILGYDTPAAPMPALSMEDAKALSILHKLDRMNRKTVIASAQSMLELQEEQRRASLLNDYMLIIDDPTPAAAGTGCDYSTEEPTFTFVAKNSVNTKADHLIHVSGNSMEPLYVDGDIVYVQKTQELITGQDYVCDTASGRVIKRAGKDRLYSLNRDLPYPEQYEDDNVHIFGRVLGILRQTDIVPESDYNEVCELHHDEIQQFRRRLYA